MEKEARGYMRMMCTKPVNTASAKSIPAPYTIRVDCAQLPPLVSFKTTASAETMIEVIISAALSFDQIEYGSKAASTRSAMTLPAAIATASLVIAAPDRTPSTLSRDMPASPRVQFCGNRVRRSQAAFLDDCGWCVAPRIAARRGASSALPWRPGIASDRPPIGRR